MRRPFDLVLGRSRFVLGAETKIMGILNITPDSFSDGGKYLSPDRAVLRALQMQQEGAHLIDIGGESSRPGSLPVSTKEEIQRLQPVLKRLARRIQIPISVDTYKYDVASMALDEGAVLINDIYALRGNKRMARLIARHKAGVVLMHMRGRPQTMQKNTRYQNLILEITTHLKKAVDVALDAGISRSSLMIDPGFGFGKTIEQNRQILQRLREFSTMKLPILVGLSRKSFIGSLLGSSAGESTKLGTLPAQKRLYGSLGAAAAAVYGGAHFLRVHEVLPHKHLAVIMDGMEPRNTGAPTRETLLS